MASALKGLKVIDLSRVLAGPVATQILGDLGADIIKIEKPGTGDDTRSWGPPFLKDKNGNDTDESAYYLCANRNKRSLAIDITTPDGQTILHKLLSDADILIENFKVGGLKKYGLDYDSLKIKHPRLIYCSITGFGQTGPLASEPGYDYLAQALGGLMAATGEKEGQPMKAGVALSDVMAGLYATIGILTALQSRGETGEGQHVDISLLNVTLAGMTNLAQYYLTSGHPAPRQGNAHATIVPYQTFEAKNGHLVIACGNDSQFRRLAGALGHPSWADDPRFASNKARVTHREELIPLIETALKAGTTDEWMEIFLNINVPAAPVNTMDAAFAMNQVKDQQMDITLPHPLSAEDIHLVGSPLKLSATPASYDKAPPLLGEHTENILTDIGYTAEDIARLKADKVI